MARIDGVAPDTADPGIRPVLDAQTRAWGAPLANHLLYARRPSIFRGLVDAKLVALINRRVAALNGCEF